jgi:hypothetical protein
MNNFIYVQTFHRLSFNMRIMILGYTHARACPWMRMKAEIGRACVWVRRFAQRCSYTVYAVVWDIRRCSLVETFRRINSALNIDASGSFVTMPLCRASSRHVPEGPIFKGQEFLWPLKMGPIGCSETLVHNHHSTLCNIPEERRSHLHRGGSLKSRRWYRFNQKSSHGCGDSNGKIFVRRL